MIEEVGRTYSYTESTTNLSAMSDYRLVIYQAMTEWEVLCYLAMEADRVGAPGVAESCWLMAEACEDR